jgi:galactofuranosylgalactofuranosylrhamnosyl-N-acetylglucosaminyl-diphospho-decaprenol beta-1,5/1,6-galactofuranosyltransferase
MTTTANGSSGPTGTTAVHVDGSEPGTDAASADLRERGRARVLARVVLPEERDLDVLPLYVDVEGGVSSADTADGDGTSTAQLLAAPRRQHPEDVLDRRRMRVQPGARISFGSYLNAFPASYWQRWTVLDEVELHVRVTGPATVLVMRSTASGSVERVQALSIGEGTEEHVVRLPLRRFIDGGWYWFDVAAGAQGAVLERAEWVARAPQKAVQGNENVPGSPGTATVAITTFDRPESCAALVRQLAEDEGARGALDRVIVVDQGRRKVTGQPDLEAARSRLGERLTVLEQPNLGGSGGFSRGMAEALAEGASRYVLLLDDDVVAEPEGILRGLAFADLCRTPTIVGGHMFSLYARSTLHSVGESVQRWRFFWGPARAAVTDHDFSLAGLRATRALHRRVDVDYNGWWMCLLPLEVVRSLGLSLPYFIKWDDAEYGLRAAAAGVPTVSLPGMNVWHVPWTDKDDALDWQAYFHQRNRAVTALLHSPYPRGGRFVRESLNHQVKHVLALQYSVAELRLQALEDVLSGPEHLHAGLAGALPRIRELRQEFPDARSRHDLAEFPPTHRDKPLRKGREPEEPRGPLGLVTRAATAALHHLREVPTSARLRPQEQLAAADAQWWRLAGLDSALVSSSDGTSAAWYQRDRSRSAELLARSVAVHRRLLQEWPALAERYREQLSDVTSVDAWAATIDGAAR